MRFLRIRTLPSLSVHLMFLSVVVAGHTRLYLFPCHLPCEGHYGYCLPNSVSRLFVSSYHDGPFLVLAYPKPVTAPKCELESVAIGLRDRKYSVFRS
ncbi:uncharacterized protein BJ212DRAFT_369820 [Suillus subaureus]|uniref:Secreted protein n=1 Tax=Suillus subaureus TaxID=48587 RepID=A0A9P7E8H5_9AGAM|nr:uncharacterized protein BJ212DRAFT_369820 [Suillus subaureus]KAG1814407.1 hypothetical protein BJ212DRAFT_369820 [Suillus subaureus]